MRIFPVFVVSSLIFISSCTWGGSQTTPVNPYPSTPLGVSTEVKLPTRAPVGGSYKAKGTEPFWAVDATPGKATLSRPTDTGTTNTDFIVTEDDKGAIVVIRGVRGDFFLNMTKGSCSDGMSDMKYEYNTTLLVGAESLTGCALKQK